MVNAATLARGGAARAKGHHGGRGAELDRLHRRGRDPGNPAPVAHGRGRLAGAFAPAAVGLDALELEGERAQRERFKVRVVRVADEARHGVDDIALHAAILACGPQAESAPRGPEAAVRGLSPSVTIANGSTSGLTAWEPATRGRPCPPEAQARAPSFRISSRSRSTRRRARRTRSSSRSSTRLAAPVARHASPSARSTASR